MTTLGANNVGTESCDYNISYDWDTGWIYTQGGTQRWIQGSGGYADDWWDCMVEHSVGTGYSGYYYNSYPYVSGHYYGSYWVYQCVQAVCP